MILWRISASEADIVARALRMASHAGVPLALRLAEDVEEKVREDRGETVRVRTD